MDLLQLAISYLDIAARCGFNDQLRKHVALAEATARIDMAKTLREILYLLRQFKVMDKDESDARRDQRTGETPKDSGG